MMYGESSMALRDAIADLLHQRRIATPHADPVEILQAPQFQDYRDDITLITRYRHAVLGWCLQTSRIAAKWSPTQTIGSTTYGAAYGLHEQLLVAFALSAAGSPSMRELTTSSPHRVVELWRQAARAAVLAEADFNTTLTPGTLGTSECFVILQDVAEITRAMVMLERRYRALPGWPELTDTPRLARHAASASLFARPHSTGYSVDHRGQNDALELVSVDTHSGIAGVLAAEHNLHIHLRRHFPTAIALRLVLDSQRALSATAATLLLDRQPDLEQRWTTRAQTYRLLTSHARTLGGLVGHDAPFAEEATALAACLRHLQDAPLTDRGATQLDELFKRIDAGILRTLRAGANERLYFQRVTLPRIDTASPGVVRQTRTRYAPLGTVHSDLLGLAATRLTPPRSHSSPSANDSRRESERAAVRQGRPRDQQHRIEL